MNEKYWIDDSLFKKIRRLVPIAAVDILALYDGRLLLLLRNNEPLTDVWFTPGGRVRHGETLEQAVKRKLREETGLKDAKIGKRATMCHFYPGVHYITTFFRAEVANDNVRLNEEHRDFRWISNNETDLHPYVKQMIKELEIFS